MAEYKGITGNLYVTHKTPFAGGGEGDIYDVVGLPDYVVKVYKTDKRTKERERKLSVMVSNKPGVIEQYAWPLDVLYENGKFIGYIMAKIKNKEKLRNIYVYDNRRGKPWSLFITIAKNLSAAVYNVHEIGQIIGDLNPDNILVNPKDGMVTLVDTDSYHISDSKRTYRCGVGMPEFVAPELQGIHFPSASLPTFTTESDRFALAVLIFALLMNGSHPFSCRVSNGSSSKFQPIDNIKSGRCAFFRNNRSVNMEVPLYAPDLSSLPAKMQELFQRAFVAALNDPSLRPHAEEWYAALEELEDKLEVCSYDYRHIYYKEACECPWCKVRNKMQGSSLTAISKPIQAILGSSTNNNAISSGGNSNYVSNVYNNTLWDFLSQIGFKEGVAIASAIGILMLIIIVLCCMTGVEGAEGISPAVEMTAVDESKDLTPQNTRTTIESGREVENNDSYTKANSINLDERYSGSLSDTYSAGEQDWYKFTLTEPRSIYLHLYTRDQSSSSCYWDVSVRSGTDPETDVWQKYVHGNETETVSDKMTLDAGTYYVEIESSNEHSKDPYEFEIEQIIEKTENYISLSVLPSLDNAESFEYYNMVKDNYGTTYKNGIGGTDGYGQSVQEYKLDGAYKEMRGRVVLNYDVRTQTNDDIYLWIYGDNIALFMSEEIKAGCQPQDFTIDVSGVSVLKVVIQGKSMLRLVDCGLYKDSSVPTVTTAAQTGANTFNKIYLSNLEWFNASSKDGGFKFYDSITDNYGTTYRNGLGGTDGWGQSFQEYKIDSLYSEMRGRVVLNYEVRTQTNDDIYLWIYGDNNLLFQSQAIKAGCEPQDFVVDLSGISILKVVIEGESMLRLVDCTLYKDSSIPTVSTAKSAINSDQKRIYLSDLEWFNASSQKGGFKYYDIVKDNNNVSYANGIGGTDGWGHSFQEYMLDRNYAKLTGRVVLNYDAMTKTDEDVYLWIYGDNALLFQSQMIKAGCEPQDFIIDVSEVNKLKVVIYGESMLRLVDCILEK